MSKVTRKSIALFTTIMLLATTLMALTIFPAQAASVELEFSYEADGANTKVTISANSADIAAIEFAIDMTGKTYVAGGKLAKGAISQVGFVQKDGVVKYLGLYTADPEDDPWVFESAGGKTELCWFTYSGSGQFSAVSNPGGELGNKEAITALSVKNIDKPTPPPVSPSIPVVDDTPTPEPSVAPKTPEPNDGDGLTAPLKMTMVGTLVDCDGKPLKDYKVVLNGLDVLIDQSPTVTDKDGRFVFVVLTKCKKYEISFFKPIVGDDYDKDCGTITYGPTPVASKVFYMVEGSEFSASADKITYVKGTTVFAVTFTLDKNKNIIIGTPVPCSDADVPCATKAPGTSGGSPKTGDATNWVVFGLVQLLCAGAIITLIARRRRATQN